MTETNASSDLNVRSLPQDELVALRELYKDTTLGTAVDRAAAVIEKLCVQHGQIPTASSLALELGGSKTTWIKARHAKFEELQTEREQAISDQAAAGTVDLTSVIDGAAMQVKTATDAAVQAAMLATFEGVTAEAYSSGRKAGVEETEALYTDRLNSVTAQRDNAHDEAVIAGAAEDTMRLHLAELNLALEDAKAAAESTARGLTEQIEQLRVEREHARLEAAEAKGALAVWMLNTDQAAAPKTA
ncbi:hypothetical protein [Demequina aurantiaca]|uniref:hypothetical protein n=1 Tax=Demequina aurantiaca TaxID=676200 RepID=UPI003D33FAB2